MPWITGASFTGETITVVLESGAPREVHHFSLLIGYGAGAINPYLAFETIDDMIRQGLLRDIKHKDACKNFVKAAVKGVVITSVDSASDAAEKRLSAGEVIVEVAQEAVTNAADVKKRVEQLKKDGKKSILLLVSNADGELRFVALSVQ